MRAAAAAKLAWFQIRGTYLNEPPPPSRPVIDSWRAQSITRLVIDTVRVKSILDDFPIFKMIPNEFFLNWIQIWMKFKKIFLKKMFDLIW